MRRVHWYAVVLVSAVGVFVLITKNRQRTSPAPNTFTFGPAIPDTIKLPDSISGKPITEIVANAIFLHVSRDGVVIHPFDRKIDEHPPAEAERVEAYLNRRAEMEKAETGERRPEGTIILRIDRETPFEKVYPILRAVHEASYEKYQLRVRDSASAEAFIPLSLERNYGCVIVCETAEQPKQYAVRVAANDSGQITGLSLREYGSADEEGENIGTDLTLFEKNLTGYLNVEKKRIERGAAKGEKIPTPELRFEIAAKLQQQSVVRLLDIGLHVGFNQAWLVPLDPAKR